MQQIQDTWTALSMGKRAVVLGGTLMMFLAIASLGRLAANPSMELLYSGLDAKTSGEILTALDARSIPYEVRNNSIYVAGGQRDSLRMDLAAQGLPRNGSVGYELLDGLSGFGTTSQMFDAAYWRAKEGELTRTITSNPFVRNARVHLSNQSSSPFARAVDASASVTVSSATGALPVNQAKAIQFLVASAVAGLTPQDVAVIDDQYGLIDTSGGIGTGTAVQAGRGEDLRKRVQRLLEARVGRGNVMVEVSVEAVTESETIRETTIDPNSRVAISTTIEERSNSEQGNNGQVTVASNLPEGDTGGAERQSEGTETREQTNFEVSEVQRELLRGPGAIKRLTVAVLLNGTSSIGEDGSQQFSPRSEEELADLRDLVSAAVGFSAERGDTITLKSLEFEPLPELPEPATASLLNVASIDVMDLIKIAALLIVTVFVGLFIVRPVIKPKSLPAPLGIPSNQAAEGAESEALNVDGAASITTAEDGAQPLALEPPDPVDRLRQMIDERHEETVEVLRRWISEPKEPAQ